MSVITDRWKTKRRDRSLSSSDRAGAYSRRQAYKAQLAFARDNWRLLALVGSVFPVMGVVVAALSSGAQRWFFLGCFVGASPAAVYHLVVLLSGSASLIMGDLGEQWTRNAMRKSERAGWHIIYGYSTDTETGDVDAVAVGPGGVVVLETKWSAVAWSSYRVSGVVGRAVARLIRRRRAIQGRLADVLGEAAPHAALVLWSPIEGLPAANSRHVDVIDGASLESWMAAHEEVLTTAQIEVAWQVLKDSHSDLIDIEGDTTRSITGYLTDIGSMALAALVTPILLGLAAKLHGVFAPIAVVLSLAVLGWKTSRLGVRRPARVAAVVAALEVVGVWAYALTR